MRTITRNPREQQAEHGRLRATLKTICFGLLFALLGLILSSLSLGQTPANVIPKTWDTESLNSFQMPLADPRVSAKFISSSYYYSIPVRPIYKSYDVYRPDREPRGYMDQTEAANTSGYF